jgi:aminopeptidase YwaD
MRDPMRPHSSALNGHIRKPRGHPDTCGASRRASPPGLAALTSGFERLDAWVKDTAALAGLPIATHLPLMANSDHANFAAHGIPAVRLIAGFNAPDSNLRLLLTAADTRDKVHPEELDYALRLATTLTWQALAAADATLSSLAARD